jgi:DNA polymerase III epsilon subunit-like protein
MPIQEIFISVDVEAAGPVPGEYSLLTIGACNVYEPARTFECQLKPSAPKCDPEALAVTGLSLEHLAKHGLEPAEAMLQFENWIKENKTGNEDKLVFVGFNAAFDWSFINYYFHRYLGRNPFGFSALDIKALYMGKMGGSWGSTKSSHMDLVLNPKLKSSHDALEDAQYQAELFRLVRESGAAGPEAK